MTQDRPRRPASFARHGSVLTPIHRPFPLISWLTSISALGQAQSEVLQIPICRRQKQHRLGVGTMQRVALTHRFQMTILSPINLMLILWLI